MDELLIEDMDDELVRAVEQLALKNGRTFDAQVIHLLEMGLELEKQQKATLLRSTVAIAASSICTAEPTGGRDQPPRL